MSDAPFYPPENYYRVSIKALIFDDQQRLLVFQDDEGMWEVPGGGWDHDEDYKACITRELAEEVGVKVSSVGPQAFFFRCHAQHGQPKVSIAVRVTLADTEFKTFGDSIVAARFVTKDEFMQLSFQKGEAPIQQYVDKIWLPVEKTARNQ